MAQNQVIEVSRWGGLAWGGFTLTENLVRDRPPAGSYGTLYPGVTKGIPERAAGFIRHDDSQSLTSARAGHYQAPHAAARNRSFPYLAAPMLRKQPGQESVLRSRAPSTRQNQSSKHYHYTSAYQMYFVQI